MLKKALGIIEIKGLTMALEVGDAMVKTAHVNIVELEKTNGFGWVTVKIVGDVSSVAAAIELGQRLSQNKEKFISCKVISRPSDSLDMLIHSEKETEKFQSKKEKVISKETKVSKSKKLKATEPKPE